MLKNILVCDGCGKEITSNSDTYKFSSERFTDAAGSGDNNIVKLDLCERCISSIKQTLEKISKNILSH